MSLNEFRPSTHLEGVNNGRIDKTPLRRQVSVELARPGDAALSVPELPADHWGSIDSMVLEGHAAVLYEPQGPYLTPERTIGFPQRTQASELVLDPNPNRVAAD